MKPIPEVTDLDCAFGAAMRILPPYKELPDEFRSMRGKFCDAVSQLFYKGGTLSDLGLRPKEGVDESKVYRVLKACLGDFAPSHEHKIGGTGYLLSQWYETGTSVTSEAE